MLLLPAAAALAHASFLGSDPPPGTRLARSPSTITLRFDEALNRSLSTASLYVVPAGRRVTVRLSRSSPTELALRPSSDLGRGAYRVEWHSVSADDGHELDGSFSFGVQAAAADGARATLQGPLAGSGWLRALLRALFYPALLVFSGGLILQAVLGKRDRGSWLLPPAVQRLLQADRAARLRARADRLVLDAGLVAVALAALGAYLDARAAGGGAPTALREYLLDSRAGAARIAGVGFLLLSLAVARRQRWAGAMASALALGALAFSGHADSVQPRWGGVLSAWVHLIAVAVWIGGITLVVLVWGPTLRAGDRKLRRAVVRSVVPSFGGIAVPAFIVVAATGVVNATLELDRPAALWQSAYGRLLLIKSALVALIALVSYTHALRLRPRLLAANPHPPDGLERDHRRALFAEPLLGVAVAVVVALLVAYPVPSGGQTAVAAPVALAACNPCPLALPAAGQLAVAGNAGSHLVALRVARTNAALRGEVRVFDVVGTPTSQPFEIQGSAGLTESCGSGCRSFTIPGHPAKVGVAIRDGPRTYRAALPARWQPAQTALARRILDRAQATMRVLRTVREWESVNSVPGIYAITDYKLEAPRSFSYRTSVLRNPSRTPRLEDQTITIGGTSWQRASDTGWTKTTYGGGLPFATRSWFTWTSYAEVVRLLSVSRRGASRLAAIALMDPGTPAWWRLTVDLDSYRVLRTRLITYGHYMTQRYFGFNAPLRITAPRSGG